jgi:drug/metabolite transporter (DMT)-like permease
MFVAVSKIGAVKAGLLMNFEPLASLIIGVVFLGQILTLWQFFGVALVLVAIVYTALGRKAEESEN